MNSKRKTVLITGCSSGLGKYMCLLLKKKGWHPYATCKEQKDVVDLQSQGFDAFMLDLNSSDSIRSAVANILKHSNGSLSALVNNAGFGQMGAVEDMSREVIRNQFETNVFGQLELTSRILPVFRAQGHGRIVFITSVSGEFAFPFFGAYAASKGALSTFCDALRRELWGSKIKVTDLCPSYFKTNFTENILANFYKTINVDQSIHKDAYAKIIQYLPSGRGSIESKEIHMLADRLFKILEHDDPQARIFYPFDAMAHHLVHKELPVTIQEFILRRKMKRIANA